jgi:hypothetical protein
VAGGLVLERLIREYAMKRLFSVGLAVAAVCLVLFARSGLRSGEKEPVTLKGTIMCAHCELKEQAKCQTVIQVKEDGKEVTYYFQDHGSKEGYHDPVCGGGRKEGAVTGTVSEKDGKKWITPSKVQYARS